MDVQLGLPYPSFQPVCIVTNMATTVKKETNTVRPRVSRQRAMHKPCLVSEAARWSASRLLGGWNFAAFLAREAAFAAGTLLPSNLAREDMHVCWIIGGKCKTRAVYLDE